MERIAFIFSHQVIHWNALILTLAALTAICGFLSLYLGKGGNAFSAFAVIPLALVLSIFFARLIHWYCYAETYESFLHAVTNYRSGGFALIGVFGGCLLAAVLTRITKLHGNLPQMLDCMCLSGGAAIAAGRLASFFNSSDRGQLLQTIRSMPWAYPVTNSVSGATEYRLATFLLQAIVTGCITLALLVFFLSKKRKDGDTTLLFLLCYGAAQVVLDSTRYDSIYFRSNGFVSIVQVFSALALGFVILVFSVRLVKNRGFRLWYLGIWLVMAALVGGAGYMEYHVQRHGNEAVFAYSLMSGCLLSLIVLMLFLFRFCAKAPKKQGGRFLKNNASY